MNKAIEYFTNYNKERSHFIIETDKLKKLPDTAYLDGGMKVRFPRLDFAKVSIKRILDGKPEEFKPTIYTWSERRITQDDIFSEVLEAYIRGDGTYDFIFISPELKKILNFYAKRPACTAGTRNIPKYILHDNLDLYSLQLATNEFAHYSYGDACLVYDISTMEFIAEDYIASIAYEQSIENLQSGAESLLYMDRHLMEFQKKACGIDYEAYLPQNETTKKGSGKHALL